MKWKKTLTTFVVINAIAVFVIFIINKICHYLATMHNIFASKNTHIFDWRFGKISYTKSGSGSPLLLIHNLDVSSSSHEWSKVVDDLSKTRTVYTIDLLGCGKSEKPLLTYTNFLYVQLVSDFIKQIIGEKVDVITSGNATSIPLMTALYNNDLINKVILTNPDNLYNFAKAPSKRSKVLRYIISCPIIGTFLYNVFNNKSTLLDKFAKDYYYDATLVNEEDVNAYFESTHLDHSRSKNLYGSIVGKYSNINIIPALIGINNSIYILASEENNTNLEIASYYKTNMPSIEVIKMKHSKRYPQLETPKQFIEQVNFLLDEH